MAKQAHKRPAKRKNKLPNWVTGNIPQPTKSTRTHIKHKPAGTKKKTSIPKVWRPEHVLGVRDKKK